MMTASGNQNNNKPDCSLSFVFVPGRLVPPAPSLDVVDMEFPCYQALSGRVFLDPTTHPDPRPGGHHHEMASPE